MRERGVSFKQAINDAIRDGLTRPSPPPAFATATADLGLPTANLDRALELAEEFRDGEVVRKTPET